jgi:hypothetical protein
MRGAFERIIVRRKLSAVVNSDEGTWSDVTEDHAYIGSIHQKFTEEAQPNEVGKYGERRLLILRMPLNTAVTNNDLVVLSGYNAQLNGVYVIEGLSWTRTHIRLDVRRTLFNE